MFSCDTMVAMGDCTADGEILFAKNSDRQPDEPHQVLVIPNSEHKREGEKVEMTYTEIEQVENTAKVLLCRPTNVWGAEMGANEFGVVVGNEALFCKIPPTGLVTGLDYVRLALERGKTAFEAMKTITTLLEKYGQGGDCGFSNPHFYHNAFLIVDSSEAWVLETVEKEWAAVRIKEGVRAISNCISIGREWDLCSDGLVPFAIQKGWCTSEEDFHFGHCYQGKTWSPKQLYDGAITTFFGTSRWRRCRAELLLSSHGGQLTPKSMMGVLRDHSAVNLIGAAGKDPSRGVWGNNLCMHSSWPITRPSQTTGSMVSVIHKTPCPFPTTNYVTSTSSPCFSVFKPIWLECPIIVGEKPAKWYDEFSVWWKGEIFHRNALLGFRHMEAIQSEQREMETGFIKKIQEFQSKFKASGPPKHFRSLLAALSLVCFTEADRGTSNWIRKLQSNQTGGSVFLFWNFPRILARFLYDSDWKSRSKRSKISMSLVDYDKANHLRFPQRFFCFVSLVVTFSFIFQNKTIFSYSPYLSVLSLIGLIYNFLCSRKQRTSPELNEIPFEIDKRSQNEQ